MNHVDLTHCGLQGVGYSPKENSGDILHRHVGLTHVGCQDIAPLYVASYTVKGTPIYTPNIAFSICGAIIFLTDKLLTIRGRVYSPTFKSIFNVNGGMSRPRLFKYTTLGIVKRKKELSYLINGSIPRLMNCIYKVISNKTIPRYSNYFSKGILKVRNNIPYKVIASIRGVTTKKYKVLGCIIGFFNTSLQINGNIIDGIKSYFCVDGKLSVTFSKLLKVSSRLDGKNVGRYYLVKGTNAIISYVCRVPIRFQEFITNKRWFR